MIDNFTSCLNKILRMLLHCLLFVAHASYVFSIDFNIRGEWIVSFGYGENGSFQGKYKGHGQTGWGFGQDCAETKEKITLNMEAVASENLCGILALEMGDIYWGQQESGGALQSNPKIIKVNNALIDFIFPDTNIKTRMGIFGLSTPAMASGNSIYNGTAPGIMVNTQVTENLDLTIFWVRLFNNNYAGYSKSGNPDFNQGFLDNIDAFGFLFPFVADGFSITPWVLYSSNGPNAFKSKSDPETFAFGNITSIGGANIYRYGMFPVGGARHKDFANANDDLNIANYSNGWWGGLTGTINLREYLVVSYDLEYGSVSWPNNPRLNRHGWFGSVLLEYLFDWGKPGIYCWHSSGDDGNPANGSERLPALDGDDSITYSHFAFNGSPYIERNSLIGANLAGTWGIGVRILDAIFIENIIHTFRINLIGGTNNPVMAKKMSLAGLWANGKELNPNQLGSGADLGIPNLYLTSKDTVLEISSTTSFKLYNDFLICVEGAYAAIKLDTGTNAWGARHSLNQSIPQRRDAWNMNISFVYSF